MARTEAKLTACMITQQLDVNLYTGWTDDEKKAITNADVNGISNALFYKLQNYRMLVSEMHIIIHDKDVREVWDTTTNNYVIEQKPPHFHAVIKFLKDEKGCVHGGTLKAIATAVGLEPQYVEKPKRGKYAYDNMLSYLIHIKYPDKAQYEPTEVYTSPGTNYMEYYRLNKKAWEAGRVKKIAEQARIDIDGLEEKILTGEICRNQILLTDEYYAIYARYKRRCDDALDTYAQRKIAKTIQAMENGDFKVSVIFVTGRSHSGKSVFTDNLVKSVQKKAKAKFGVDWDVCSCAASNPFDEYNGEEILVMDDLRGVALSASDWLKLLDPDRINVGSARYRNRKIACRTIIINSEKDVFEFFYYLKGSGGGNRSEAMDQFIRRIMARVRVYRVPDGMDTREVTIGKMEEIENGYDVTVPGSHGFTENLRLHHMFNEEHHHNMTYEDALEHVSDIIIDNNKA